MSWKHEGSFASGITIWTLEEQTDKYSEVSIHTFGGNEGYTLTLGMHQASRFKTLEDAQACASAILNAQPKTRKKHA
jgi:hypothetical protein